MPSKSKGNNRIQHDNRFFFWILCQPAKRFVIGLKHALSSCPPVYRGNYSYRLSSKSFLLWVATM